MYNPDSIQLLYNNGTFGALSNICHGNGRNKYSTALDLADAAEDSKSPEQLLRNLNRLNLIGMDNMTIDRDTDTYTRIKGSDVLGNAHFLKFAKIWKE